MQTQRAFCKQPIWKYFCWLRLFSAEGRSSSRYLCFYLAEYLIPVILAVIKGELFGWQTVHQVQMANRLWPDWLLKNWLWRFCLQVDLSFSALGAAHSLRPIWDWPKLLHVCNVVFLMSFPSVSLWNTDTTPPRLFTSQVSSAGHSYLPESCACACVHVLCVFLSHLPLTSALVCRVLVCQSCVRAYVCLCSSAVRFHSNIQKVTPTR